MSRSVEVAIKRGELVTLEDGFLYYWPDPANHGALPAHALREPADELDRRNAAWAAELEKVCG